MGPVDLPFLRGYESDPCFSTRSDADLSIWMKIATVNSVGKKRGGGIHNYTIGIES